jgi:hypothetical protein
VGEISRVADELYFAVRPLRGNLSSRNRCCEDSMWVLPIFGITMQSSQTQGHESIDEMKAALSAVCYQCLYTAERVPHILRDLYTEGFTAFG